MYWGLDRLYYRERIYPGVYIGGVPVGGLSPQAAEKELKEAYAVLKNREIAIGSPQDPDLLQLSWKEAGITPDLESSLQEAYRKGRAGWEAASPFTRLLLIFKQPRLEVAPSVDERKLGQTFAEVSSRVYTTPRNAYFKVKEEKVEIVPEIEGIYLKQKAAREKLLELWQQKVNQNSAVRLELPLGTWSPEVSKKELSARGIEARRSGFSTEIGDNPNRKHNIITASRDIHSLTVPPGETFSFNRVVGKTTREKGYLEAPVIVEGEFVSGPGGGICQVSSTLYNALLKAGVEIVERHQHSMAVSYLEPGRDAAVAYDYLDLKFRNNHHHHLLLESEVEGGRLSFFIYGKELDGDIEIETTDLETVAPPEEYREDPAHPPGYEHVEQEGKPGYRVKTWRIYCRGEEVVERELISEDYYHPTPTVIIKGAGEKDEDED